MPKKKSVTDSVIVSLYEKHGSIWKVAEDCGICGQSVHERLVKLNKIKPVNLFTESDKMVLIAEYQLYRSNGDLESLAEKMGRTKQFICRKAKELNLTNPSHEKEYSAVWKYMKKSEAEKIFDDFISSKLSIKEFCNKRNYDPLGFANSMSNNFPGEYAIITELSHKRKSKYYIGRDFEFQVKNELSSFGYSCIRSQRSSGIADLIAYKKGIILFIQCKTSDFYSVEEWNELYETALSVGALPIFATKVNENNKYYKIIGLKDRTRKKQPHKEINIKNLEIIYAE